MEKNSSISHVLPNLLIGLCKGSKSLGQYATIFHNQLGYDFFRCELSFTLEVGEISVPDAIVFSTKMGNTLVFEWTESEYPDRKHNQLIRYSKITSSDLANTAAVPTRATNTHDIVFVLRQKAINNYSQHLLENGYSFPILVLDQTPQNISLVKAANSFQIQLTDEFFTTGLNVRHIIRYIPFSLDTINPKEIVPLVIQHLVSLLVKGENNVSLLNLCQGVAPVWNLISERKQREISNEIKTLMHDLLDKGWSSEFVKRSDVALQTWMLFPESFKKNQKGYRNLLRKYISDVQGDSYQMSFDFEQAS